MPVGLIFSQNKAQCNGIKSTALFFLQPTKSFKISVNKEKKKLMNDPKGTTCRVYSLILISFMGFILIFY